MKDQIINQWYQGWLKENFDEFEEIFVEDAYVSKSYGEIYKGINEIKGWFKHWHMFSKMDEWKVIKMYHDKMYSYVLWQSKSTQHNRSYQNDMLSVIEWNEDCKIKSINEFSSSVQKYNPFN